MLVLFLKLCHMILTMPPPDFTLIGEYGVDTQMKVVVDTRVVQ